MKSEKTILTLDAGGTNFVFSAIRNFEQISDPITLPARADDLDACIQNIISGFRKTEEIIGPFDAISFAFPGPADYGQGIIGNLPNFPAFTKPVPLAGILENEFNVPVFINNDANLFAYGEAIAGFLPEINQKLESSGSTKRYNNLIGITLGTGFGCGIVSAGKMHTGDNSCGAEIHNTLNKYNPQFNAEEDVSIRAIKRSYAELSNTENTDLTPEQIYHIARGEAKGDKAAALAAFERFGRSLGASISNVLTLIDGIVVIGGGLSGAWDIFSKGMMEEINSSYINAKGNIIGRLSFKVFDLTDQDTFPDFCQGEDIVVKIAGTDKTLIYDAMPRVGVGLSGMGISKATSLGAYSFAIDELNKK